MGFESANSWLTNKDVDVSGSNINITIHSSDLNGTVNVTLYKVDKDTVVPNEDTKQTCKNIDSSNKYYMRFNGLAHSLGRWSLPTSGKVQSLVKQYLNDGNIENAFAHYMLSNTESCD